MQKAANMMGVLLTAFMLIGALIYGCGDEDLLEQNNMRYKTDISFLDAEDEDILTVDINQIVDCDGDPTTADAEFMTDLFAIITITIEDETTPGLEMTGYEVTFRPLRSYDQSNNPVTPPAVGPYRGEYDVMIPSASEVEFTITCMEFDLKQYMDTFLDPTDLIFRYRVMVRMDFIDEYNEEREITVERTIYFGAYNNC
jgi:hypothetical protein